MDCGVPTPFAIFETLSKAVLAGICGLVRQVGRRSDRAASGQPLS